MHGFRYFDQRDLLGFVDGTENPTGQGAVAATIIGAEDAAFAGGSYVIVQKYLHDMAAWNALPVEAQEKIIGRTKLSDIELDDAVKPSSAHNALTSITDADGEELEILRDNMPFGTIGKGEFGTYFIGYACSPERIERMLDEHVRGPAARELRPHPGLQPGRDRLAVLRAVGDVPGGRHGRGCGRTGRRGRPGGGAGQNRDRHPPTALWVSAR